MTLGNKISECRKNKGMTQDALAQLLVVTNQAVSKWESDQSCPDVMLLPKLADIFGITMDELFGRKKNGGQKIHGKLPWADDDTLHAVLFRGHTLLKNSSAAKEITFKYEGDALNIDSAFSVHCGNVAGDVDAGCNVCCENVYGDVDAGTNVKCGDVMGDVDAGASVSCRNVSGDVDAGSYVECGSVSGDIDAGGPVTIRK